MVMKRMVLYVGNEIKWIMVSKRINLVLLLMKWTDIWYKEGFFNNSEIKHHELLDLDLICRPFFLHIICAYIPLSVHSIYRIRSISLCVHILHQYLTLETRPFVIFVYVVHSIKTCTKVSDKYCISIVRKVNNFCCQASTYICSWLKADFKHILKNWRT